MSKSADILVGHVEETRTVSDASTYPKNCLLAVPKHLLPLIKFLSTIDIATQKQELKCILRLISLSLLTSRFGSTSSSSSRCFPMVF